MPKPLIILCFFSMQVISYQSTPVVRAVLFYSPNCGHCRTVIHDTLQPLAEQYGSRLELIGVDVTQPQGQDLFFAAREMFGLESAGVPLLVIGDEYLIGSQDIPKQFPAMLEEYLAEGGVDWPNIPGLWDAIQVSQNAQALTPTASSLPISTSPSTPAAGSPEGFPSPIDPVALHDGSQFYIWQRVLLDPLGNGLAIAVLIMMLTVFFGVLYSYRNGYSFQLSSSVQYLIPILSILGLSIAGYLAFIETTHIAAVCGPVGDCNTVQQSEYARLFGVLPIGILGVAGYFSILASWGYGKYHQSPRIGHTRWVTFALTTLGLLFSIYLTFLEPFVIGATCLWCLSSAVIMTALFVLTFQDAKRSHWKPAPHHRRRITPSR